VRLRGVSFDRRSRPFDCFQQVYPASEIVFSISGQTARHVFRGTDLRDWSVAPLDGGGSTGSAAHAGAALGPGHQAHSSPANRTSLKGEDNV